MTNTRIMFLRDASYRPVGCVAISLDRRNHRLNYGISVLNPADKFDRKLARQLAIGRLVEVPFMVALKRDEELNMHVISERVMKHVAYGAGAPSRAVRAAKLWLLDQGYSGEA
jgi:hypothetical protein